MGDVHVTVPEGIPVDFSGFMLMGNRSNKTSRVEPLPGAEGLTVGKPLEKMGLRTSPMAEVFLDDCFVPDSSRLGAPGQGGEIFTTSMRWERSLILAAAVGTMRRQLERCNAHARERVRRQL